MYSFNRQKVTVPHWARGVEVAELTQFPGQAPKTTQKIVLTALGGSVATPAEGLTAEVVVVNDFDQLASLGREKAARHRRHADVESYGFTRHRFDTDRRDGRADFRSMAGYASLLSLSPHRRRHAR